MRSASRRWAFGAVAAVAAVSLLTGCTEPDPEPGKSTGSSGTQTRTSGSSSTTEEPKGPTPEELSAQVLDASEAAAAAPALGAATGAMHAGFVLTVEVTKVERVTDATLVEMRWSTTGEPFTPNPAFVNNERSMSSSFARGIFLDDPTVTKTRYLPLQFTNTRPSCACPNMRLTVGEDPITVYALYPELPPEVTTVNLQVGPTEVVVPDLPVTDP